jgi:hypothetical protein
MTGESVSATTTIHASAEAVFAVLADPAKHASIDGTGWVTEAVADQRIAASGQVFQMAMYHPDHPDGSYETYNLVLAFDPPRAISWKPGYVSDDTGDLAFGGWTWRYDLNPLGPDATEVELTYDWSAVGSETREYLEFPPFPPDHLENSLTHLAELVRGDAPHT